MATIALQRVRDRQQRWLTLALVVLGALSTLYYYQQNLIIAYGDAESHLNISKRVIHSLTPGLAQLGGIWLPLPHLLMLPFVAIEPLYRTGLAGSIVSGAAYVVSGVYIYKTIKLLTSSAAAALGGAAVFMLNPNILYLQATPMTELPLIACFMLSTYYFVHFIDDDSNTLALIAAAFFGCMATLMRYDGWFLVIIEVAAIGVMYLLRTFQPAKLEGKTILFATPAFFGILLWLIWDLLILGDPLYFTNSPFSAKSQQNGWAARGQLPAHNDLGSALTYYTVTAAENVGMLIFGLAAIGMLVFLLRRPSWRKCCIALLLMTPFLFNVVTLYMGQSIILIPQLTPDSYINTLFNVRYGVLMVPTAAICIGYLLRNRSWITRGLIVLLVGANLAMFGAGMADVITLEDGKRGLSRSYTPDAELWLAREYDGGIVMMDDFSKSVSIVRSGIPMQNMLYVGNQPYWDEAMNEPQRRVRWIVMHNDDSVYQNFMGDPAREGNLYKYYVKTYTSPDIQIFRRNEQVPAAP